MKFISYDWKNVHVLKETIEKKTKRKAILQNVVPYYYFYKMWRSSEISNKRIL